MDKERYRSIEVEDNLVMVFTEDSHILVPKEELQEDEEDG